MTIMKEKREKIEYRSGNFAANHLLYYNSSSPCCLPKKISPKEYVPWEN